MMGRELLITNGRLIDTANDLDQKCDLYIKDGKIAEMGQLADKGLSSHQIIDAQGSIVMPGIVDLCASVREPGAEHQGTIRSETNAAIAGGVTTLCSTPDSQPVADSPAVIRLILDRSAEAHQCRILPIGALTKGLAGQQLAEMAALRDSGCIAVSQHQTPIQDNLVWLRALEYAATFDICVFLYPCDPSLSNQGCAHDGPVASRLGLGGVPPIAETVALARDLQLVRETGARVHFGCISSAASVELIRQAKAEGLRITADVSALHLLLNDEAVQNFDSNCHLRPPLRSESDRLALLTGLQDGTVDAICSAHQPQDESAKKTPFASSAVGAIGLQTLLPICGQLIANGEMSMLTLVNALTLNPSRIVQRKSRIAVGFDADLCIWDPQQDWSLDAHNNKSLSNNSPLWQTQLKGTVTHTVFKGLKVFAA